MLSYEFLNDHEVVISDYDGKTVKCGFCEESASGYVATLPAEPYSPHPCAFKAWTCTHCFVQVRIIVVKGERRIVRVEDVAATVKEGALL